MGLTIPADPRQYTQKPSHPQRIIFGIFQAVMEPLLDSPLRQPGQWSPARAQMRYRTAENLVRATLSVKALGVGRWRKRVENRKRSNGMLHVQPVAMLQL